MEGIIKKLKTDEELTRLKKEWSETKTEPFPPFNMDQYGNTVKYKERIKEMLSDK